MTYSPIFEDQTSTRLHFKRGAPGRTRTNTSVRKPDFETGYTTHAQNVELQRSFCFAGPTFEADFEPESGHESNALAALKRSR
jgi:hypothetical protein